MTSDKIYFATDFLPKIFNKKLLGNISKAQFLCVYLVTPFKNPWEKIIKLKFEAIILYK